MARIANSDAKTYVRQLTEFQGSHMYGCWVRNSKGEERYGVYSYGPHFPMYIWEHEVWYENTDKYSATTSRHQSQTHPGTRTVKMDTDTMRALMRFGIAGVAVGMK